MAGALPPHPVAEETMLAGPKPRARRREPHPNGVPRARPRASPGGGAARAWARARPNSGAARVQARACARAWEPSITNLEMIRQMMVAC
jgi:hypothetical protein